MNGAIALSSIATVALAQVDKSKKPAGSLEGKEADIVSLVALGACRRAAGRQHRRSAHVGWGLGGAARCSLATRLSAPAAQGVLAARAFFKGDDAKAAVSAKGKVAAKAAPVKKAPVPAPAKKAAPAKPAAKPTPKVRIAGRERWRSGALGAAARGRYSGRERG